MSRVSKGHPYFRIKKLNITEVKNMDSGQRYVFMGLVREKLRKKLDKAIGGQSEGSETHKDKINRRRNMPKV